MLMRASAYLFGSPEWSNNLQKFSLFEQETIQLLWGEIEYCCQSLNELVGGFSTSYVGFRVFLGHVPPI